MGEGSFNMEEGWKIFQTLIVVGTTIWISEVEVLNKRLVLWA